MKLEHSFTVPVPPEQAWEVLLDVRRIAPCMPGASVESVEGEEFTGTVKVKVGPITVTYRGSASFTERDAEARRAVIEARAKETRGAGTARATITGTMRAEGDGTRVDVVTDLAITGKPAQFGRGVMADVGGKLIGQFADCLAAELGRPAEPEPAPEPAPEPDKVHGDTLQGALPSHNGGQPPPRPTPPRPTPEAIDLLGTAGAPLARRLAPALAALAAFAAILVAVRRRRH